MPLQAWAMDYRRKLGPNDDEILSAERLVREVGNEVSGSVSVRIAPPATPPNAAPARAAFDHVLRPKTKGVIGWITTSSTFLERNGSRSVYCAGRLGRSFLKGLEVELSGGSNRWSIA